VVGLIITAVELPSLVITAVELLSIIAVEILPAIAVELLLVIAVELLPVIAVEDTRLEFTLVGIGATVGVGLPDSWANPTEGGFARNTE